MQINGVEITGQDKLSTNFYFEFDKKSSQLTNWEPWLNRTRSILRRQELHHWCNTPGVLNPKICHVIICIAHHFCVSENFDMHSLKQVYFYDDMCWLVWMNQFQNLCIELEFQNPNFQHLILPWKNLIQNLSIIWGWT